MVINLAHLSSNAFIIKACSKTSIFKHTIIIFWQCKYFWRGHFFVVLFALNSQKIENMLKNCLSLKRYFPIILHYEPSVLLMLINALVNISSIYGKKYYHYSFGKRKCCTRCYIESWEMRKCRKLLLPLLSLETLEVEKFL